MLATLDLVYRIAKDMHIRIDGTLPVGTHRQGSGGSDRLRLDEEPLLSIDPRADVRYASQ